MLGNGLKRFAKLTKSYCTARLAEKEPFTPRRALMYVPASDERKLAKIATLKADCVVIDCEVLDIVKVQNGVVCIMH